jgi:hypothetical protein
MDMGICCPETLSVEKLVDPLPWTTFGRVFSCKQPPWQRAASFKATPFPRMAHIQGLLYMGVKSLAILV